MGKIFTIHFLRSTLFFSILYCFSLSMLNAQTTGEFIPFEVTYPDASKGDDPIIRGNMVIFGNSIKLILN